MGNTWSSPVALPDWAVHLWGQFVDIFATYLSSHKIFYVVLKTTLMKHDQELPPFSR